MMDDQRDYAEEAANRALLREEDIPWYMPTDAAELIEKLYKLAKQCNGHVHGDMFHKYTGVHETDIEFKNAHDATKFAFFVDMFYDTKTDFRDEVRSMHDTVVITVTKRF